MLSKPKSALAAMLLALLLAVLLAAPPLDAQHGARVLHRNLAQLVGDSHVIVIGRVTSVRPEVHPKYSNLNTVLVTVDVSEVLKGHAGVQYTFRLALLHPTDFKTKLGYAGGQEVMLMLTQPHPETGFSSPAGLEQGRFQIVTDASGSRVAVNGMNNAGLFRNIAKVAPKLDANLAGMPARQLLTQHNSGPIAYDQLKSVIQTLVASSN